MMTGVYDEGEYVAGGGEGDGWGEREEGKGSCGSAAVRRGCFPVKLKELGFHLD